MDNEMLDNNRLVVSEVVGEEIAEGLGKIYSISRDINSSRVELPDSIPNSEVKHSNAENT